MAGGCRLWPAVAISKSRNSWFGHDFRHIRYRKHAVFVVGLLLVPSAWSLVPAVSLIRLSGLRRRTRMARPPYLPSMVAAARAESSACGTACLPSRAPAGAERNVLFRLTCPILPRGRARRSESNAVSPHAVPRAHAPTDGARPGRSCLPLARGRRLGRVLSASPTFLLGGWHGQTSYAWPWPLASPLTMPPVYGRPGLQPSSCMRRPRGHRFLLRVESAPCGRLPGQATWLAI